MISRQNVISNENVSVSFSLTMAAVSVIHKGTNEMQVFTGTEDLAELFLQYWDCFQEQTDFESTVAYFSPAFGAVLPQQI